MHDGVLDLGVQNQAREVGVRVIRRDRGLLTQLGQTRGKVLRGRTVFDAAFAANGSLTQCHDGILGFARCKQPVDSVRSCPHRSNPRTKPVKIAYLSVFNVNYARLWPCLCVA